MKIKALVVEHKDAPFVLQEIDIEEPGRRGSSCCVHVCRF